jgi:Sulfotransferase domain
MTDDRRPDRPRVFCIGLNKTATSSFHEAMTILGFESLHHGGPEVEEKLTAAIAEKAPLLTYLDPRYDAFSDIGQLSRRFVMLNTQYPGSRFVLTVRPVEQWLDSRRRHVENNIRLKAAGNYDGRFTVIDEEKWRREWSDHLDKVHAFFETRDSLLEIDFTCGPGWGPLCAFLQLPQPDAQFPWANRDKRARQ